LNNRFYGHQVHAGVCLSHLVLTHASNLHPFIRLPHVAPLCLQYASNAAAAEYLEKQTNETIPYDGFDWIELRVDSSTKTGAGARAGA
jgi:hypothetical protein